ncbi:MAG: hypothetical protein AVDCRST_MAG11-151, partial [uncultured Gemmatimonadaceae bacterium]
ADHRGAEPAGAARGRARRSATGRSQTLRPRVPRRPAPLNARRV